MGPVFFVMAIMGCGDGSAQCVEARVDTVRYSTIAQCRADLPAALARNTDLSFPVVVADCRPNAGLVVARAGRMPKRG